MRKTLEQIRQEGLKALRKQLGLADTIRFLRQFEIGKGDYSKERHVWVDATSMTELRRVTSRPPNRRFRKK